MLETNFISLYEKGFAQYWDKPALSNYQGNTYHYRDLATEVAKMHLRYKELGIRPGDKIALMGKDTAEWVIVFLSTITYGAVIVPILQDFSPQDAMEIVRHSESRMIFINAGYWANFEAEELPLIELALEVQDASVLYDRSGAKSAILVQVSESFAQAYPKGYSKEDIQYYHTPNSEVLLLNYTSGTTGFSKGVMVTGNNMAGNVLWCREKNILPPLARLLSFLPLAHTYGCMVNVLLATTQGVHVTFLGRTPSPAILGPAFKTVRPHTVVCVPLILEKIYMNSIVPALNTPKVRWMLRLPILSGIVKRKMRDKLIAGMGGEVVNVIAGGAALNPEVGAFLQSIGFPISVGYGMTECAPLISYTPPPGKWRLGSCGQPLEEYMQVRITPELDDQGEPHLQYDEHKRLIGEIQVKGENVCRGYYRNAEQTAKLFTEDGWLRTGDLGTMDKDGYIYIKGRSKTMLLGASGQNIYPEEIEAKIALLPYVLESLVVMRDARLEALIVLNSIAVEQAGISMEEAWEVVLAHRSKLNEQLGSYEKVQRFEQHPEPFEKTPKQSIKRFLYR